MLSGLQLLLSVPQVSKGRSAPYKINHNNFDIFDKYHNSALSHAVLVVTSSYLTAVEKMPAS